MKKLKSYILEGFKLGDDNFKSGEDKNRKDPKDPNDPKTWEVGDILAGTWTYSMIIPYFYEVVKKTPSGFGLVELSKKVVSGHYNGQYTVIPDDSKHEEDLKQKPISVRIKKSGSVKVRDVYVYLWNGKPLHGDDQD